MKTRLMSGNRFLMRRSSAETLFSMLVEDSRSAKSRLIFSRMSCGPKCMVSSSFSR